MIIGTVAFENTMGSAMCKTRRCVTVLTGSDVSPSVLRVSSFPKVSLFAAVLRPLYPGAVPCDRFADNARTDETGQRL